MPAIDSIIDKFVVHLGPWRMYKGSVSFLLLKKFLMRLLFCFQVFDISPQQQQWLTNHLGHTLDIHKIHYRQTSVIIERVDISKLMLLTEYGLTGKYTGKKFTDITLEGNDVEFFICVLK